MAGRAGSRPPLRRSVRAALRRPPVERRWRRQHSELRQSAGRTAKSASTDSAQKAARRRPAGWTPVGAACAAAVAAARAHPSRAARTASARSLC